jgi:hypothetical protein
VLIVDTPVLARDERTVGQRRRRDHPLPARGRQRPRLGEPPARFAELAPVVQAPHGCPAGHAIPGARLKSVVQSGKDGLVRGLKASLAEAMGKFSPDRTKLPITDPNRGVTTGRA